MLLKTTRDETRRTSYGIRMTGAEVIEEIKRLPTEERQKVIDFTRHAANGQQSPEDLEKILRAMVDSPDPIQKQRLKAEFMQGVYGNEPHA